MTPAPPTLSLDVIADAREARHRLLGDLDTQARVSTRAVRCIACQRALLPTGLHEYACACPQPRVVTVDQLLDAMQEAVDRLTVQLRETRDREDGLHASLAGATARAECAEAVARTLTGGIAEFLDQARTTLGVPPAAVVPAQVAAELAQALTDEATR